MGQTYVEFGDHGLWVSDAHIELWLYLISTEVDRMDAPPGWLLQAREYWLEMAVAGTHGVVMPDFDTHLDKDEERVRIVLELHDRVRRRIESYGEKLPREAADGIPWFTGGYPTEDLAQPFGDIERLLRGEGELAPLMRAQREKLRRYVADGMNYQEARALVESERPPKK